MEKLTASFRIGKIDESLDLPRILYNVLHIDISKGHVEISHYGSGGIELVIYDLTYEDIKNLKEAITKAESALVPKGIAK